MSKIEVEKKINDIEKETGSGQNTQIRVAEAMTAIVDIMPEVVSEEGTDPNKAISQDAFTIEKQGVRYTDIFSISGAISKASGNVIDFANRLCTDFYKLSDGVTYTLFGSEGATYAMLAVYDIASNYLGYINIGEGTGTKLAKFDFEAIKSVYPKAYFFRASASTSQGAYLALKGKSNIESESHIKYTIHTRAGAIGKTSGIQTDSSFYKNSYFLRILENVTYIVDGVDNSNAALVFLYDKFFNPISAFPVSGSAGNKRIYFTREDMLTLSPNAVYFRSSTYSTPGYLSLIGATLEDVEVFDIDTKYDNVFSIAGGISRISGNVTSVANIKCTPHLRLLDKAFYTLCGFDGESVALLYVYDQAFNSLGFINVYGQTGNAKIIAFDLASIREKYPTAHYFRSTCNTTQGAYLGIKWATLEEVETFDIGTKHEDIFNIAGGISRTSGNLTAAANVMCTPHLRLLDKAFYTLWGFDGVSVALLYIYDKTFNSLGSIDIYSETSGTKITAFDLALIRNTYPTASFFRATASISQGAYLGIRGANLDDVIFEEQLNIDRTNADSYTELMRQATLKQLDNIGADLPWYGITYKEESNPDNVTKIASDMSLHTSLPIQSKMKRCLVKDGVFQYWLDPADSTKKDDGTDAILDGADGDVMVYIPSFYYHCNRVDDDVTLKISEHAITGWEFMPARYTSAFEATINNETESLASVVTTDFNFENKEVLIQAENNYTKGGSFSLGTQKTATISGYSANATTYRGGDSLTTHDDVTDTSNNNWSLNNLGRSKSNVNRSDVRRFAKNKGNGALTYLYDTHKALWILSFIEVGTRQFQKSFSEGGLGKGATVYPNYNAALRFYNDMRAIIPMGVTLRLGNESGEVYFDLANAPVDDEMTDFSGCWMPVMSYRGVENFYGHQYKLIEQINIRQRNISGTGNNKFDELEYYYVSNPYLSADDFNNPLNRIGKVQIHSYIRVAKKLLLGKSAHFLPSDTGGNGYTANYCDSIEIKANGIVDELKYISVAGRYVSATLCGPLFLCSDPRERVDNPTYRRACNVTRLDYVIFEV